MPIRVKCGNCKKTLSVKDHLAGKKIKCPVCQGVVVASAVSPPKTPPTETPKTAPTAFVSAPTKPIPTGRPESTRVKVPPNGKKPVTPAGPNGQKPSAPASTAPEPPAPRSEDVEAEAAALFAEKPPAKDEGPTTIDFKCEWCDEPITVPIDMAGKRTQCTNEDCRRITKVPVPTVQKPKDWRKMDRVGPAAAIVSQPEQLDNAWGTENTTKARQDSLAKAGAVDLPPPPPLGAVEILRYFVLACFFFSLIGGLGLGGWKLFVGTAQVKDIVATHALLKGRSQVTTPVLAAQVHHTLALMYMTEGKHGVTRPADRALEHFQGARSLIRLPDSAVNEHLFLIELALSEIDLGGSPEESIAKTKQEWEIIQKDLLATLELLKQTPEVQLMAVREVCSRLVEKSKRDTPATQKTKADMALKLASALSDRNKLVISQQVALLVASDQGNAIEGLFKEAADREIVKELSASKDIKKLTNAPLRIGFAEGHARKGAYAEADKLIDVDGPPRDQLEACLGVASIALARKPDEAKLFIEKALVIAKDKNKPSSPSHWHLLHLATLAARVENEEVLTAVKELIRDEPFKRRVLLEVVRAKCDKAVGEAPVDLLADLEASKDETTLALAWHSLAQQHVRKGCKRSKVQQTLTDHTSFAERGDLAKLRPIVEIGAIRGALK